MAEKKLQDLPSGYSNLAFDGEPVAGPSAPKLYEDVSSEGSKCHMPSIPTAPFLEEIPGPRPLVYNPPTLVFEEIYEACALYVKQHCCYGSKFIKQIKVTAIENMGVFHYTLESFGEKRESAWRYTAYKGGPVDGPENGIPPQAWDMSFSPPKMFQNCDGNVEIPHTAKVSTCTKCGGCGTNVCSSCHGRGNKSCISCSGSGRNREGRSCTSCSGRGRKRCWSCSGSGKVTCSKCDGYGKVKDYRVLIVTWRNHLNDFISNAANLPDKLVRKSTGIEMFREAKPQLLPIENAPDQTVNVASTSLLSSHRISFPNELIIRQRHILRVIPFTRVTYQWRNREGEFYLYDVDRKVFFEDYPQQCCCCTCC